MSRSVVYSEKHLRRPRGWSAVNAWCAEEARPCGIAGGLGWHWWNAWRPGNGPPGLDDCVVARPRPWQLVIWEPILTKAPGPALARPYCCYIKTVIFYHRPYICSPWVTIFECNGRLQRNSSPGHFEQWDEVETRLTWEDQLSFEGERFDVGGGRVMWANLPGQPRRWWMRHGARRKRDATECAA